MPVSPHPRFATPYPARWTLRFTPSPSARTKTPTERNPILLSYLDTVVQGFLTHWGRNGVDRFFASTDGWSAPILNDRDAPIYSRVQRTTEAERDLVDALLESVNDPALSKSATPGKHMERRLNAPLHFHQWFEIPLPEAPALNECAVSGSKIAATASTDNSPERRQIHRPPPRHIPQPGMAGDSRPAECDRSRPCPSNLRRVAAAAALSMSKRTSQSGRSSDQTAWLAVSAISSSCLPALSII